MNIKTNHFQISESVAALVAAVVSQLQMNEPFVLADLVRLEEELVAHVTRVLPHPLLLVLASFDVDCQSRSHLVPDETNTIGTWNIMFIHWEICNAHNEKGTFEIDQIIRTKFDPKLWIIMVKITQLTKLGLFYYCLTIKMNSK